MELRYKAAMEAAGAAVLAANPRLLVVVDALYYGRDLTVGVHGIGLRPWGYWFRC